MPTPPDYTKYSLEQLQCARRSIDEERFPERVAELDRRIGATIASGAALTSSGRSEDDEESFFRSQSKRSWQPSTKFEAAGMICLSLLAAPIAPLMILQQKAHPSTPGILFSIFWVAISLFRVMQGVLANRKFGKNDKKEPSSTSASKTILKNKPIETPESTINRQ